jgi:manganese/iron transport system permease protein
MMGWATFFGAIAVYIGLLASYHFDIATGPAIVLVNVLIFFLVFIVQNLRVSTRRRVEAPAR